MRSFPAQTVVCAQYGLPNVKRNMASDIFVKLSEAAVLYLSGLKTHRSYRSSQFVEFILTPKRNFET